MVRTQRKLTPEEKKDTQKKKSSSKKAETGIWPCKINGCNKEFAREADLKRHQRTTKLHSQPGFACPQCDATFTRTDALRRHQKSRHNGVIIDPGPPVQMEENTGETSRSHGATPKPKNKVVHLPPTVAPGSGALPGYYRQQGINAEFVVFVPPRTQGVIVDPNYAVGHPTSAARLAQPTWGPPPWADGTHPVPPYPIPGAPPPGYFAPYYHPGVPLPLASAQFHPNAIPYAPSSGSPNGTCVPSEDEPEVPCSPQPREVGHPDKPGSHAPVESSAPVIDPSLDAPDSHPNGKSPISLAITSAAMQAVLVETRRIARQQGDNALNALESRESSPHTYVESALAEAMKCADSDVPHVPSAAGRPSSTMLTEDGETMLHPAELLTQESLASPPPAEES